MQQKRIVWLNWLYNVVSVELQRFLSHFESFKSTSPLRRQIEAKRNLLEKIRDFDPSEYGSDCEEYEVCINVKEVMSLCNEEKSSCYRELDALQRLEELVNHAIETQVGIRTKCDRRIMNSKRTRSWLKSVEYTSMQLLIITSYCFSHQRNESRHRWINSP